MGAEKPTAFRRGQCLLYGKALPLALLLHVDTIQIEFSFTQSRDRMCKICGSALPERVCAAGRASTFVPTSSGSCGRSSPSISFNNKLILRQVVLCSIRFVLNENRLLSLPRTSYCICFSFSSYISWVSPNLICDLAFGMPTPSTVAHWVDTWYYIASTDTEDLNVYIDIVKTNKMLGFVTTVYYITISILDISLVLLFKRQRFGDCNMSPSSVGPCLSWTQ